MDNIFKKFRDPNKPKFHLSELFLGVIDNKLPKKFVLFMLEVHFTLLCPNKALLPAADVPKSKMYRKKMEFSKSSIDKELFSTVQFSHFLVPKIHFFIISDPDH